MRGCERREPQVQSSDDATAQQGLLVAPWRQGLFLLIPESWCPAASGPLDLSDAVQLANAG
jgi:hypothetical protein